MIALALSALLAAMAPTELAFQVRGDGTTPLPAAKAERERVLVHLARRAAAVHATVEVSPAGLLLVHGTVPLDAAYFTEPARVSWRARLPAGSWAATGLEDVPLAEASFVDSPIARYRLAHDLRDLARTWSPPFYLQMKASSIHDLAAFTRAHQGQMIGLFAFGQILCEAYLRSAIENGVAELNGGFKGVEGATALERAYWVQDELSALPITLVRQTR